MSSQIHQKVAKVAKCFFFFVARDAHKSLNLTTKSLNWQHCRFGTTEIAVMTYFWHTILQRFQATSLQLQKPEININTATQLLISLRDFVAAQRDNFAHFERSAWSVTDSVSQDYRHDLQRTKKRKHMADESAEPGVEFGGKEKFRIETFNVLIDKLVSCLDHRLTAYTHLTNLFHVLFMPDNMSITSRAHF